MRIVRPVDVGRSSVLRPRCGDVISDKRIICRVVYGEMRLRACGERAQVGVKQFTDCCRQHWQERESYTDLHESLLASRELRFVDLAPFAEGPEAKWRC